jgi:hypothetical protein
MDEKKKLYVLIGLAVAMVAIGAFVFIPRGGSAQQAEPVVKKELPPKAATDSTDGAVAMVQKNPGLADLPARDPFAVPVPIVAPNIGRYTPPPNGAGPKMLSGLKGGIPGVTPGKGGTTTTQPTAPVIPPFTYTISGVVIGPRPAVVFRDLQGNQMLVPQGAKLDGDTRVMSVGLKKVTVLYHGSKQEVTVGGESLAKQ